MAFHDMAQLIAEARHAELSDMSNRRIVKMSFVMLVHRLYREVKDGGAGEDLTLGQEELHLLWRFGLDHQRDLEGSWRMERLVEPRG